MSATSSPSNLTAQITASGVALAWQDGANPTGTQYTVERIPVGTSLVTSLTTTALNSFTDASPLKGTAVTYAVMPTGTNLQAKIVATYEPIAPAPASAPSPTPAPAPASSAPPAAATVSAYPSDAALAVFARDANGYPIYPVPANAIVAEPTSNMDAVQGAAIANGSLCVLFKRGVVYPPAFFNDGWQVPGQSWQKPFIFGATADVQNPKPVLQAQLGIGGGKFTKAPMQFMVAFSLSFQDPKGIPGNAGFVGGSAYEAGIRLAGDATGNLIFDDIDVEGFQGGIEIQGVATQFIKTVILFRCCVRNNFGQRWGVYTERVDDLLIEEGLYDQNGWSPANSAIGWAGLGKSIFCHNIYIQMSDPGDAADAQCRVRGIATSRASSHGLQQRLGGLTDGIWFWGNPLAGFDYQRASTLCNSVIEGGGFDLSIAGQPRGNGFQSNACPQFAMKSAIFCNKQDAVNTGPAVEITCKDSLGNPVATAFSGTGVIVNGWSGSAVQIDSGSPGSVAFDATSDVAGYSANAGKISYVDPTVTSLKYAQGLGYADVPTLLNAMALNRRGSFNAKLTARAVISFMRSGFTRK
jgi:hypothetical protein